ncbi:MAG: asparagine synthase (glutamine-hydrolyzing) [Romboutsia sp.]|uniref:asparagine synthase (glutamine-hydrolyzing) n=1 Tax=Romboutsia sp. TaxID=1965302 RepID=UPI003F33909E
MCSICGIIDFINKDNLNEKIIREMGKELSHRGPDQKGVFINNQVAFQHNRLAIMDLENGIQPMTRYFNGNEYTIVYNGEIYNINELKIELESYGVKFQTKCDTEVVLYAYIIFKEECAQKLNGIFAFAVLDKNNNKVYIARDRFGIKPLFYTQVGTSLLFASEIKGLLKHPKISPTVDKEGLWQLFYLAPMKINGTSVFKDIHEIKPGYFGVYKNNELSLNQYWNLESKEFEGSRKDAIEQTRHLVSDAINIQLVSDVPLCTFLSGGLDSSIISSVASKKYKEECNTLGTYSFEYAGNKDNFKNTLFQPESDDDYARYLADYLQTNHKVLTADTKNIVDLLFDATKYRDLPGMADIDSSLLYYCSKVKENHTVAISGECADEVFGGYPWFYKKEMLERDFFPWIHDPHTRISLFDDSIVKRQEGYEFVKEVYKNSVADCNILDTDNEQMKQSRIATWLSTKYFMTSLLERKDRMSMATGVEVRVPFADHRILEYVFNVPWEYKFENGVEKSLLRNAMADYLPDKILNRKKSPYPKTHNPHYEEIVTKMLKDRLEQNSSMLRHIIDKKALNNILQYDNITWFGQLMSKPQLIAWLIQLDYWFELYNIDIK